MQGANAGSKPATDQPETDSRTGPSRSSPDGNCDAPISACSPVCGLGLALVPLHEARKSITDKMVNINQRYMHKEKLLAEWSKQVDLIDKRVDRILSQAKEMLHESHG